MYCFSLPDRCSRSLVFRCLSGCRSIVKAFNVLHASVRVGTSLSSPSVLRHTSLIRLLIKGMSTIQRRRLSLYNTEVGLYMHGFTPRRYCGLACRAVKLDKTFTNPLDRPVSPSISLSPSATILSLSETRAKPHPPKRNSR